VRVGCGTVSSSDQPVMYPSCSRTLAMFTLIFEEGMDVASW